MGFQLWPIVVLVGEVSVRMALTAALLLRRRPGSPTTLAWIMIVLSVPVAGTALYLLLGETRLGLRRARRQREIMELIQTEAGLAWVHAEADEERMSELHRPIAVLANSISDTPARTGNEMDLYGTSELFVQSLIEAIDHAKLHCHLLFYIYLSDHSGERVAKALMNAAQRGVKCRVLVDAVASRAFLNGSLCGTMREAGVRVVAAMPANAIRMLFARLDLRNHRKIAVIDGQVGFTGSQNIADAEFAIKPKYAPWVDAMVRIEGPGAWDLQMLFIEDWYLDTDEFLKDVISIQPMVQEDGVEMQVLGTGPNTYNEALRQMIHSAIHSAKREVILTTPYFVPDDTTILALQTAARRGIRTVLVVPKRNDSRLVKWASRGHYAGLLESGVEIYEFTKGLLHAKTMTVDADLALVSSANLDRRSFDLNFEVSAVVYDDDFASQLRFLQRSYMDQSEQVDARGWMCRGWMRTLTENAAGLMSPLL